MANNYELLISKLDEFIRKYYLNKLFRGTIYTVALILAAYLIISLLEFYLFFPGFFRKFLFYGFLGSSCFVLYKYVILPAVHMARLGKIISHEQAAEVIGQHFKDVKDRLLNILQLNKQIDHVANKDLIIASINQKTEKIKLVPFSSAIRLSGNTKYLKYAIPPVLVLLFILFSAPNILRDSNQRLINNNAHFIKAAPFQFVIKEDNLEALQNQDLEVEISIDGEALPAEVFVITKGHSYRATKKSKNGFVYTFKKLQDDQAFYLNANGYNSADYKISVLAKPAIISFSTRLNYPGYLGRKDETLSNIGDMQVPQGTVIDWEFASQSTSEVSVFMDDSLHRAERMSENLFAYHKVVMQPGAYTIYISNENIRFADSIGYQINVIPDRYPSIKAEEFNDSLNNKYLYFIWDANDDYGIRSIAFRYRHTKNQDLGSSAFETIPVSGGLGQKSMSYFYNWDLTSLNLKPGDKVEYYFIVWDNDGVNGSKFSKTPTKTYEMPSYDEYKELNKQTSEEIKKELSESLDETKKLKEEIKEMQEKLLQKKELSWEDKKAIENLMEKQKNLQKQVNEVQQKFEKNLNQQSEYKESTEERIQEKQEKLQELFDELLSEEMKEMMAELERLMEKLNQEQAMENLGDFEMSNEELEKELDRMLELYKQMEFEQKAEELKDELEKLVEEQEKLSEKNDDDNARSKDLAKEQEEVKEKFEDIKNEMDELEKMNEELERKHDLDNSASDKKEVDDNMNEGLDKLQQNQKKKATKSQKKAAQKMQEMADKLSTMMSQGNMEQMAMDMEAIRQLLENLITLSFDQENLIDQIITINVNTPRFTELIQEQHKLKSDSKMVEDSLFALSKRVFQISSFVNREIENVNRSMDEAIDFLANRRKPDALGKQQYVMTGYNNLALMLDEIMQAMQQQMASQMSGKQMCQSPNSGQSMEQMGKMQKDLNEQLSKMKGELKKGGKSGSQMSKQMAKMAAKQAALRKALEEMNKEMNKDGKGSLGNLQELTEEMEKTEEDLVNKRLTNELLERQKEILVRLLEAADAMREREKSPERESNTADDITKNIPPSLKDYLKKRQSEVDLYKTVPPALKPFYKNIVEEYFKTISISD